jgi:hypothetical protein
MKLRVVHFLAILLTALAFIPAGADCHDLLGCVAWALQVSQVECIRAWCRSLRETLNDLPGALRGYCRCLAGQESSFKVPAAPRKAEYPTCRRRNTSARNRRQDCADALREIGRSVGGLGRLVDQGAPPQFIER